MNTFESGNVVQAFYDRNPLWITNFPTNELSRYQQILSQFPSGIFEIVTDAYSITNIQLPNMHSVQIAYEHRANESNWRREFWEVCRTVK